MGSGVDQLPKGNEEIVTEFKWEKWEVQEIVTEFKRKKWEVQEIVTEFKWEKWEVELISYLREMRRL